MDSYRLNDLKITIDRRGADRFAQASYPARYGRYGEIKTKSRLLAYLYLIQRL